MLLLACGLVATVAITTTSCKKDDGGTPATSAPTVTSFTPTSATSGATVTITGTNFTGATAVSFGGVAAASYAVVNSTTITAVLGSGATGSVSVTAGGKTGTKAGFTYTAAPSSNDVASSYLIAHWTFDADSKETGSGVGASTTVGSVTYGAGRIGNAATFVNGGFVYPTIPNLNLDTAMQSYTVSMWIKMKSREGANTKWSSLWQLNSNAYTDVFGIVGIQALNQKSKDTLALQIDQVQIDGTGPHLGGFGCGGCFGGVTNPLDLKVDTTKWSLLTVTYNGVGLNQKLKVYLDGVAKDSLTLTTVKKPDLASAETFRIKPGGGPGEVGKVWEDFVTIGTFNWRDFTAFSASNGYGSFSPYAADRAGYMANGINGSIDDIRVFNTAISADEVMTLYTRGSAGN